MSDDNNNENENEKDEKTPNKNKNDDARQIMRAMGLFMQLGLSMVTCIVIGFFIGRFLDGIFGTSPVIMLIFCFIGMGAALKVMYDIVKDWD